MPTTDYLPVAVGSAAVVDSQANFAGSSYQTSGFTAGIAQPAQVNKVWRQGSMVAAAVANFILNTLGINVPDDGNLATLVANFTNAVKAAAGAAAAPKDVVVPYSPNITLDCSQANPLHAVFEVVLTGNVAAVGSSNFRAGQLLTLVVRQDAAGGHAWPAPTGFPGAGDVSLDPFSTSIQTFVYTADGNFRATTGVTVS